MLSARKCHPHRIFSDIRDVDIRSRLANLELGYAIAAGGRAACGRPAQKCTESLAEVRICACAAAAAVNLAGGVNHLHDFHPKSS